MVKLTPEFLFKVRSRYATIADQIRQVGIHIFNAGTQLAEAVLEAGNEQSAEAHVDLAGVYAYKLVCLKNATLELLNAIHVSQAVITEVEDRFELVTTNAGLREGELLASSISDDLEAGQKAIGGGVEVAEDADGDIEVQSDTNITDEELIRAIFGDDAQIKRVA